MSRTWLRLGLWSYFICACFFLVGGVQAGDFVSLGGTIGFFLGAVFFLVAHYTEARDG